MRHSYGVAVFAELGSGGEGSVGIPHPMFPPWANHGTSELLLEVWHKREGWCGPPMVGRPVITITPARAFCTGLEVGGFRFRRTLPNHVETEPSSQVAVGTWAEGVCPPSPTGRDVRDPRVTLRFGCNTTVRRVQPPARATPRRVEYVSHVGMQTFKHTKVGVYVRVKVTHGSGVGLLAQGRGRWFAGQRGCEVSCGFRVPDACNRLHAPRRGGAAAGLSSPPGRCRTR